MVTGIGTQVPWPGAVLFWLKETCVPVQVCGAGDAALNKAYKNLVPAWFVYHVDVKLFTLRWLLLV